MSLTHLSAQRPLRRAALTVAALAGLVAPVLMASTAADARAGSTNYGKVVFVADGDTVDVNVRGDGTRKPVRVRYIGVQAMELNRYSHTLSRLRGECWSVEAARHLHSIVDGKPVRLTARKSTSVSKNNVRPRRHVAVKVDGRWQDTGAMQVSAGLALPDLIPDEFTQNLNYLRRAQEAAAAGLGMWGNPAKCGEGPNQTEPLKVDVNWDADGNDSANVNGEWIDITNLGSVPVPLGGWWVRDAAYRGFKAHGYPIPAGVTVDPGARLRIHVGHGTDSANTLYWGLDKPVFANVSGGSRWMGDGGWLFDPDGDLRAWDMYPCRAAC